MTGAVSLPRCQPHCAGWLRGGGTGTLSPSHRSTAPARPYRLKLSLVVLGQVTGLIDVRLIPGLQDKWALVKPQLSLAVCYLFVTNTTASNSFRYRLSPQALVTAICPHTLQLPKASTSLLDTPDGPPHPKNCPCPPNTSKCPRSSQLPTPTITPNIQGTPNPSETPVPPDTSNASDPNLCSL